MTARTLIRPDATEYAPFYAGYVARVPDGDVAELLEAQGRDTAALLAGLSEERGEYRYAPDKWTLKEVIGHIADAERIFAYRALRIARGDQTPLASFDENAYVPAAECGRRTLADLAAELGAVRGATLALVRSLTDVAATRTGTASGKTVSVRALAYIAAGHERHHLAIIRERYLP
jgi:hypothetical protein